MYLPPGCHDGRESALRARHRVRHRAVGVDQPERAATLEYRASRRDTPDTGYDALDLVGSAMHGEPPLRSEGRRRQGKIRDVHDVLPGDVVHDDVQRAGGGDRCLHHRGCARGAVRLIVQASGRRVTAVGLDDRHTVAEIEIAGEHRPHRIRVRPADRSDEHARPGSRRVGQADSDAACGGGVLRMDDRGPKTEDRTQQQQSFHHLSLLGSKLKTIGSTSSPNPAGSGPKLRAAASTAPCASRSNA